MFLEIYFLLFDFLFMLLDLAYCFSLDCFVPRNDGTRWRHCELAKQSRNTDNESIAQNCH